MRPIERTPSAVMKKPAGALEVPMLLTAQEASPEAGADVSGVPAVPGDWGPEPRETVTGVCVDLAGVQTTSHAAPMTWPTLLVAERPLKPAMFSAQMSP